MEPNLPPVRPLISGQDMLNMYLKNELWLPNVDHGARPPLPPGGHIGNQPPMPPYRPGFGGGINGGYIPDRPPVQDGPRPPIQDNPRPPVQDSPRPPIQNDTKPPVQGEIRPPVQGEIRPPLQGNIVENVFPDRPGVNEGVGVNQGVNQGNNTGNINTGRPNNPAAGNEPVKPNIPSPQPPVQGGRPPMEPNLPSQPPIQGRPPMEPNLPPVRPLISGQDMLNMYLKNELWLPNVDHGAQFRPGHPPMMPGFGEGMLPDRPPINPNLPPQPPIQGGRPPINPSLPPQPPIQGGRPPMEPNLPPQPPIQGGRPPMEPNLPPQPPIQGGRPPMEPNLSQVRPLISGQDMLNMYLKNELWMPNVDHGAIRPHRPPIDNNYWFRPILPGGNNILPDRPPMMPPQMGPGTLPDRPPINPSLPPQPPIHGGRPPMEPSVPPQQPPIHGDRPPMEPSVPPQQPPIHGGRPPMEPSVPPQQPPIHGDRPPMAPGLPPQPPIHDARPPMEPGLPPQPPMHGGRPPMGPEMGPNHPHRPMPPGFNPDIGLQEYMRYEMLRPEPHRGPGPGPMPGTPPPPPPHDRWHHHHHHHHRPPEKPIDPETAAAMQIMQNVQQPAEPTITQMRQRLSGDAAELFFTGLINLNDLSNTLKENSKSAKSKLILAMANASKQGIDNSQINDTLKMITSSMAASESSTPSKILKNIIELYLPWYPLQQGVGFDLSIETAPSEENFLSVLKVWIQTRNYGNVNAVLTLLTTNSVDMNIKCNDNFPKDDLLKRLKEETHNHTMQSSISVEEVASADGYIEPQQQAKVNLSSTYEMNPYLLLMAHSFIKNTIVIDSNLTLT